MWDASQIPSGIIIKVGMFVIVLSAVRLQLTRHARALSAITGVLFLALSVSPLLAAPMKKDPNKNQPPSPAPPRPVPQFRIPLAPLGYKPQLPAHLLSGESVRTIDFVDNNHLLLTYSLHGLIHRQPECSVDDNQQMVQAVLLELPTGRIMARQNWRMCDHARYLWPLGHGRFLLRQSSRIGVVAPLEGLPAANSTTAATAIAETWLTPHPILHFDGPMMAINLSPDGHLLIVQYQVPTTVPSLEKLPGITKDGLGLTQIESRTISVNLYTLNPDAEHVSQIYAQRFGDLRTGSVLWIPLIPSGYLESVDDGTGKRWQISLVGLNKYRTNLAPIDSTCKPTMAFLSDRTYEAIICPPNLQQKALAIYSLDVGLLWMQRFEQPFTGETQSLAPDAGRFALSVLSTLYKTSHFEAVNGDNTTGQWIRVYDTLSGAIVTTVEAVPIQQDGHNYALSPDGLRLALLGSDEINVFALAPITAPAVLPITVTAPPAASTTLQ